MKKVSWLEGERGDRPSKFAQVFSSKDTLPSHIIESHFR